MEENQGRDPLANLDENIRELVNQMVAQKLAEANRVVKVTNVNTCIELPVYNSKVMTSETFFRKIRSYLTAQGYEPRVFHELLPMVLKGQYKLWLDSVSSTINSWDDFTAKFRARFDNESVQRERCKNSLHT